MNAIPDTCTLEHTLGFVAWKIWPSERESYIVVFNQKKKTWKHSYVLWNSNSV